MVNDQLDSVMIDQPVHFWENDPIWILSNFLYSYLTISQNLKQRLHWLFG